MSGIKIDKNVPIPDIMRGHGNRKYPYNQMAVGDSFLFPAGLSKGSCASSAKSSGDRMDRKFTVRKTAQGIRCWRVA